jgi:hypothetical protein
VQALSALFGLSTLSWAIVTIKRDRTPESAVMLFDPTPMIVASLISGAGCIVSSVLRTSVWKAHGYFTYAMRQASLLGCVLLVLQIQPGIFPEIWDPNQYWCDGAPPEISLDP